MKTVNINSNNNKVVEVSDHKQVENQLKYVLI